MATFFQRLFGFGGVPARHSSLPLQPVKEKRIILSLERLEERLAPAMLTDGLAPASAGPLYSLSNGNLYNTATQQVIANNVASFAQNGQGELAYLQNNAQLWLYGNANPIASHVAKYALDAGGAVVYLGQNGVLNSATVAQPLDNGAPIALFKMDGAGSAVVLDQNGNLIRFAPGSETPTILDSTVMNGTTVASSVVTFAVDGSGAVVVLDSNGNLNRYAPGSNTAQALDTKVSKFAIDGAGSIVALEATANPATVQLAYGQNYSTPIYNLVRFVTDPSTGSLMKTTMAGGVTTMALDGDGSVAALDSLSSSSVTRADQQIYSTPSYTMVRFAPGSTTAETTDSGVTQMAVDGAGAVVFLDNLTTTPTVTLANGQASSTPIYSLLEYTPGSTKPQVLEAPTSQSPNNGVSRFAVDAEGDVVALDNLTLQKVSESDGQSASYPLWNLVSFAAATGIRQVIDPSPVSTFALDGSGSVVALDNLSTDGVSNSYQGFNPTYSLVRLLPGSASGSYVVRDIEDADVSQIAVDASGAVFALESKVLLSYSFQDGESIHLPLYNALVRFAPGSNKGVLVDNEVSAIALDGAGSVVALDSPSPLSFTQSDGQVYNEIVYNLVRFTPGSTAPDQKPLATGVSSFTVDSSGSVLALDKLGLGDNGVVGNLDLFAPGVDSSETLALYIHPAGSDGGVLVSIPVYSFTLDGSGSVVALIDPTTSNTYTLVRFKSGPPSTLPGLVSANFQQLDTGVSSFVIDGSGSVVALKNGALELFALNSDTPQGMDMYNVSSYAVDGAGCVIAQSGGTVWHFDPGSTSAQPMDTSGTVSNFVIDATGSVAALSDVGLYLFHPGNIVHYSWGIDVLEMNVDASGSIVFRDKDNNLRRMVPGIIQWTDLCSTSVPFIVDGSGAIFALINGKTTLSDGETANTTVYTLVRFAPGASSYTTIMNDVSNYNVDFTGSVVALADGVLYRINPGSALPIMIGDGVQSFVVDGAGYIVALSNGYSLVQYAPGSNQGVVIDTDVESYSLVGGSVIALDNWSVISTGAGAGNLTLFTPGSTQPQLLDTYVSEMAISSYHGDLTRIVVLDQSHPNLGPLSRLAVITPTPNASIQVLNPRVYQFYVDSNGVIIAKDFEWVDQDIGVDNIVSYDPRERYVTNVLVTDVVQLAVLPDGSMLVLSQDGPDGESSDFLYYYPPGTYANQSNYTPIANNVQSFIVNSGVQTYDQPGTNNWLSQESTEVFQNPPTNAWDVILPIAEVVGAVLVSYFTAGAGPLIVLAASAGDALVNQTINHFAFGTPYDLGSIGIGALAGAIGADDGVLNSVEDLGDALGGVATDITDTIGDVADTISDSVNDLIDPNSFLGQALQTSFNNALTTFVTTGSLSQAGNAALTSLGNSVEQGLANSSFVQSAETYLSNAAADLPGVQDGVALLNQIASNGLSGTPFGQAVGSLLANAAKNALAGKPIFQNAVSVVGQFVSSELGNTPFAQKAVSLVNQALTNGVNASLANNILSFLGETAADNLANSSFVQSGMAFVNQTLADGLGDSELVLDGVSLLQDIADNGLAGSTFGKGVSSFLQQVGADGLDSLNSTVAGEVGTFLQDAAQEGTDFANSTLGGDVGNFLQQAAQSGTDFLNSSFAGGAISFVQQAIPEIDSLPNTLQTELGSVLQEATQAGTNFASSAFGGDVGNFLEQAAQDGTDFLDSGFVDDATSFLQQTIPQINSLPSALQTQIGSFLQDAAQAGTDFAASTLGDDAGAFLQQAAQNGVDFLGSSFASDATSFLQQTIPEINSLPNTLQTELGETLQDAAQAGSKFATSTFASEMGAFLQQAGTAGSSFLNSSFANDAVSFMQQVSQGGLGLAKSDFAVDGQALLNSVLSDNLGSLPFGQDAGAFLDQVVSNNGLASSSFADSAVSFLRQALAASQTSSDFAQGAFTLLNGVDSAQLTNMVQSIALAADNTISAAFQANSSSDAGSIVSFVNQLPSYSKSPMTVTLTLANGVSSSGITANPPPGVTLIVNGQSGTTTLVGHWSVSTTAVNTSGFYSPNAHTVKLNAAVSVIGNPSAQVNEGTVTFTVKNGQTVIGTPVRGTVSGGTASASFSLPTGLALGNYTIAVSYSNSQGSITDSGDTNATLFVGALPAISSGNSAAFTAGQGGSFTVTATGSPTPTLTVSGPLPRGVSFKDNGNGTATLSGTPAAGTQGTYHFTIDARNGVGSDAAQSFTLTVNPAPVPPPPPPAAPNVPPLLAFFNQVLGGLETVNANGTTITDNLFGFPLVETFDHSGNLVSVTLLGFNITFLFG